MSFSRRSFFSKSIFGLVGTSLLPSAWCNSTKEHSPVSNIPTTPIVISTWANHEANNAAWKIIATGGKAIDAVETGAKVPESDVNDRSVGYGGRPDRDGYVTLDACIMNEHGDAGGVCFLQGIKHPISVARLVMEKTPHVLLAGEGALQFALENGFEQENLLTELSKKEWEDWKKTSNYHPIINIEQHDTIGILAMDKAGNLSGACTTSGLAYKMHGRVGDSPIIGAGLYIDNEIGAATATGMGEAVLKSLGSFLVVELMRQGLSPDAACKEAVMRIVKKQQYKDIQIGYIAINKQGEFGSYALQPGFRYVTNQNRVSKEHLSKSYL